MGILDKFRLKDRIAVVTGGAGKYGRFIVEGLAEAEATVYVVSRNIENCENLASELRKQNYSVFSGYLDMGSTESILALYEKILKEQGKIDILVNNAVLRPMKHYEDPIDAFDLSMKINATGIMNVTRIFVQDMLNRKSGVIVNISSMQGVVGPDFTLYEGTDMGAAPDYFFHRAGLISLTRYLASKFGPYNIRVNCVSPGGLYSGQPEIFVERYNKRTFLGRMANGEDIKGVVVFLASDASSYITGANILVDGGYTQK
ncbi:MAG TPA: SDR family oxidoreductase [bacterium]|nr:SDR family oxidoreductase [bacterium]HOL34882.1 SDR family oxidoreductase [bacterium]HXK44877.1 SDR family oxidoreductase [bacterium]